MSRNNALIFRFITFIFAQTSNFVCREKSALRHNFSPTFLWHLDTMFFFFSRFSTTSISLLSYDRNILYITMSHNNALIFGYIRFIFAQPSNVYCLSEEIHSTSQFAAIKLWHLGPTPFILFKHNFQCFILRSNL